MTLTQMKALAPSFSMTIVSAALVGAVLVSAARAQLAASTALSAPLPIDIANKPGAARGFPTFCQIPPRPNNVRTGKAFKAAVFAIRLAGVRLTAQTAPGTFFLDKTDNFARTARADATPPPPIAPSDEQQTDAFINQARALARPPSPR